MLTYIARGASVAPSLALKDAASRSLFSVNHPAVAIEAVKKAEESSSIVIRAVESWGGRRRVRIHVSPTLQPTRVTPVNILEHEAPDLVDGEIKWDAASGIIELVFKPFQIITLKVDLH